MSDSEKQFGGVIELTIEGFRGISAVSINTDGKSVIQIEGPNGNGKTSVLDALGYAFCGKKWAKKSGIFEPVNNDAQRARIECRIPGYTIERTVTAKSETLQICSDNGAPIPEPQRFLDKLIGSDLAIDPQRFAMMKPVEQRAAILDRFNPTIDPAELMERAGIGKGVGDPIGIDGIDAWIKQQFDARTDAGRELKAALSKVDGMPDASDYPTELRSSAELRAKIDEHNAKHDRWANAKQAADMAERRMDDSHRDVMRIEAELDAANNELDKRIADSKLAREALENNPDPGEIHVEDEMADIEDHNARVRAREDWAEAKGALLVAETAHDKLDATVDALRDIKASMIGQVDLGIDGLVITDDGITFRGVPISQCSQSERIIISARVATVLLRKAGTIPILRITDGSAIGLDNLAALAQFAEVEGIQIWIERVEDSPTGQGWYIHAGTIGGAPDKENGQ